MKKTTIIPVLLLLTITAFCQDESPEGFIGMTMENAWAAFGVPSHIFSYRGDTPEEDDVVFYRNGLYLFWFQNRVWQVRADKNYSGSLGGVQIGQHIEEITEEFGTPLLIEGSSYFYEINRELFPLRLRIVADSSNAVEDIYLYRGDY